MYGEPTVTDGGVIVIPGGSPLAVTLTVLLKHGFGVTVGAIDCAAPPAVSVSVDGVTPGVKSGFTTLISSDTFLLMFATGSLTFAITICEPAAAPFAPIANGMFCGGGTFTDSGPGGLMVMPGGTDVKVICGVPL